MKPLDFEKLTAFVEEHIGQFHENRIKSLQALNLRKILKRKNPYLFKAKHMEIASDLVSSVLDAYLSSSEEGSFGNFLESLALHVVAETFDGQKSASPGIDLDFRRGGTRYLVSLKSGRNWGNSGQQEHLQDNFRRALKVVKQARGAERVEAVLGICYGRAETKVTEKGYTRIAGQCFWEFISGNASLYTEIIEPLGMRAKEHNAHFKSEKARIINLFTQQFTADFCTDGRIDWKRLVEFNSGVPQKTVKKRSGGKIKTKD